MAKAKVNGIEIAYEVYGEGFPLVLAHGYTATKEMWDGQIGPFMERYRVVVYDERGHGDSDAPPVDDAGYTISTLVDDQKALMDHLGIEEAYVGGLSLGGMIALRFALKFPKAVRALLLCDTSPGMNTEGQWAANRQALEGVVRSQGVLAVMRGLYMQGMQTAAQPRAEDLPAGVVAHVQGLQDMAPDGFLGIARAVGDETSVLDRLGEIAAPTLIVTGDTDFFRGASEEMNKRIAGARFVLIKGSSHGTCLWQAEKFTSAVLDFLANVDAGKPVEGSEER
jgi:pimeloyl-ACP methyl ester carboxylesterase